MKILIVYSTKTGTTDECTALLAGQFGKGTAERCRIVNGGEKIDFSKYDAVLAGGPVRYGKLPKCLLKFFGNNTDELTKKPLGLFFCCGFTDREEEYAETVFPQKLREHAMSVGFFGGEMRPGRSKNPIDKIVIYLVRSYVLTGGDNGNGAEDASLPSILEENISRFATEIRKNLTNGGIYEIQKTR